MNREDNLCWFHGRLSRERAEQILKEEGFGDGVFLVRESNSSNGDYVLSVLHQGEVCHYQIRRHGEDAFFSIDDKTRIHGLDSLIEHYQETSDGLVTRLLAIVKCDPPPHDARRHGRTNLLHRATKEGNYTVVSELLKCGYRNIDAKNQDGQTAVHLACKFGTEAILKKIIECGANVNHCRDIEGNTPLHYACRYQSASMVRLLIEAKANIQARNNETGCVPLHDAAEYGNLDAIKELLNYGAPDMPRSSLGEFPIDYAKEKNHKEVVKYLENYSPPSATTYKYQWYHGTLDRNEAVTMLKEFAKNLERKSRSLDAARSPGGLNKCNEDETKQNENNEEKESAQIIQDDVTSGVFLVRYTDRNQGSFVLTLLYENQAKHFIIQKSMKYLYIDEGPYMVSLEHLVHHYTKFSDGLPVNLRYPVPPIPKPPLPLFSTIPKTNRAKKLISPTQENTQNIVSESTTSPSSSSSSPQNQNNGLFIRRNSGDGDESSKKNIFGRIKSENNLNDNNKNKSPHRNLSVPSDDMMNKVGLLESSSSPPDHDNSIFNRKGKDKSTTDLLNFRSLKLRPNKPNIWIDGMKSLKRQKKSPNNKKDDKTNVNRKSATQQLEISATLMKNLTFSTDFLAQSPDSVYNTPTNNCAIVDIDIDGNDVNNAGDGGGGGVDKVGDATENNTSLDDVTNKDNNQNAEEQKENYSNLSLSYFTESDTVASAKNKDEEEIYFIDKPSTMTTENDVTQQSNNGNTGCTYNAAGYIVMHSVPMYIEGNNNNNNNNNNVSNNSNENQPQTAISSSSLVGRINLDRLDSTASNFSNRSESEFAILQHQTSTTSTDSISSTTSTIKSSEHSVKKSKPNYFIPKSDIVLEKELGKGEFGSVYQGVLKKYNDTSSNESSDVTVIDVPVAVKTLHDEHCRENREEFLREASVMIRLRHHCIVELIGISKGPPLMMIQELVSLGSMLDYLLENGDNINPNFELKIWASQIACGMDFLEYHHFVHRDLAARNILLASKNQAKISDFGLSRALAVGNDYYQASQGGKWPIKWYAPESFNYGTFSHASDVWSFGVTLWEMFSLGQPPYGEMKGVDVIQLIETGKRLLKPTICPDNVYQIMENCWNYNPKDRPTFRHLREFFASDPDYTNITELIKTEHIS